MDVLANQLKTAMHQRLALEEQRIAHAHRALELLNPYQVLSRGYAIVRRGERVLTRAGEAAAGEELTIQLQDGIIHANVLEMEE